MASKPGSTVGRVVDLQSVREQKLGRASRRTADVALHFGIPLHGSRTQVVEPTRIRLVPGRIVMLLGPSGSGKSSALSMIEGHFAGACLVQRVSFPADAAVVDGVAPGDSLSSALSILTSCGLSEPRLWVRRFLELSDGERFRAQLARAVGLHSRTGTVSPLLCDEFCTMLHRRAAKAISYNLHKLVARRNLLVVVASCQEDIIADLRPHTIVRLLGNGRCEVECRDVAKGAQFSLKRRLKIEPGCIKDYHAFADMHYRTTGQLGFVDKMFVLREGSGGEALGVIVYAHSPLELSLRNRVTNGRFIRNPKRVNRSFRILRRLVIHPDVRGCGLGQYLARKTLPLVGTEYVECLAAMGEFNPVFARAGMEQIGQCPMPRKRLVALDKLRAMDVDPASRAFPMLVGRRRSVREIVARVVHDWYAATTGGGTARVPRQSAETLAQIFRGLIGSRPVYYLWKRNCGNSK